MVTAYLPILANECTLILQNRKLEVNFLSLELTINNFLLSFHHNPST